MPRALSVPISGIVAVKYYPRRINSPFDKRPLKKSDPLFGLDLEHEYELIQTTSSKLSRTLRDRIVAIMEQRRRSNR